MEIGEIPTFKIYDASLGNIFDATPSEEVDPWSINGLSMNDLLEAEWSINPANFQYNGSITSEIHINEVSVGSEDDMLAAFINGEISGVVNGLQSPFGNIVFPLMVYSNETSGETLEFIYYDSSSNLYVQLSETLEFITDMTVGTAIDPFILTNGIWGCTDSSACNYNVEATLDDGSCEIEIDCAGECGGSAVIDDGSCVLSIDTHYVNNFSINSIYPNPFNPVVNIVLSIDIAGHLQLSVFNIEGIQIKTIYNGPSIVGESTFTWGPENRASGFYFISAVIDNHVKTQKVLFLK